ncbi:DUF4097 family beta strand repeat-containing protein [Actinokineospora globicatena]|uniref:DUF4097 domain-containing protein n=1 Tax=Actinokineospora globicatena TaxID=103729 RepID=A0A9W6QJS3_9PSEU|nr:DUF4097 family beta strand repeat-containing protein [Actinokineospora globicatena]MCP2304271.1 protein of unknown function (DUF4098) [Actinokineospora globicatena]GLW78367.1 hypothetical protein Aglo01_28490 [Actinokineospora globicatena]GLW84968.1 hypothetical protein Aglo02_26080 [Actinokineospora globicatena]GLW90975.1 hypothetical protein Aglo03_17910 [Actinokineospora globicatena]
MSDVRMEQFDTGTDPVEITVATGSGRIDVRLTDEEGIDVEVRHAPEDANPWADGITNLMSWFTTQFGEAQQPGDAAAEAVRRTRVEVVGGRLVVRSPKEPQLRGVPIAVVVRAPSGSTVSARSGAASVRVAGVAAKVDVTTGAGTIDVAEATGAVQATSGTGAVKIGPAPAGVQARTGRGEIELAAVGGSTTITTGGGDVWLGAVTGDVTVRSGTGDITVADATSGTLELTTGSGDLRIGIREGSPAEVDVSSGSGEARSDLPLSGTAPETAPSLRVRGRTGLGSAQVSPASR